jgi:hypothetical protein
MSGNPSIPDPRPVSTYIEDGARIAAILLVWGILAAVFRHVIGELGIPIEGVWLQLGTLFWYAGILNAVLYVLYRTVDYWTAAQ